LEHIGKALEHSQGDTQNQKTYSYYEEPEYIEPALEEKRANSLSRLGVTDLNNTFEKMQQPSGFTKSFNAFRDLAEGKSSYYMLMVYGSTGNGKTKCCEAAVISLFDRGIYCHRQRWSDIVRHLKELMKLGGYEEYFNKLRSIPYLIIDDIGSGSTGGSWEWGELEDIVDYRIERHLVTIMTTNLNICEDKNNSGSSYIPERIVSRFRDTNKSRIILNEAEDYRPLKEKECH